MGARTYERLDTEPRLHHKTKTASKLKKGEKEMNNGKNTSRVHRQADRRVLLRGRADPQVKEGLLQRIVNLNVKYHEWRANVHATKAQAHQRKANFWTK